MKGVFLGVVVNDDFVAGLLVSEESMESREAMGSPLVPLYPEDHLLCRFHQQYQFLVVVSELSREDQFPPPPDTTHSLC